MHLFDEEISADERKLLSNEGIWDIKAEQILYNVVELRGLTLLKQELLKKKN